MTYLFTTKRLEKSLVTNADLHFNRTIGLPIEVVCLQRLHTLAFGRIQAYSEEHVQVNDQTFSRDQCLFFGQPVTTPSLKKA
ncbi:hypothetical protein [Halalkalibacterium halodurans]|uniref:hypothetical protein n=1 Tax=Halalkalibacterium halodurans TaxID=86665 RepID=UPI00399CB960